VAQQSVEPRLAVEEPHEVRAWFPSAELLNEAVVKLGLAGFDRADLALPEANATPEKELAATPAHTDADARQARTLATSMAAAAGAMLAGGVIVATGGAAAAAALGAVAAGGGAGVLAGAIGTTAKDVEQTDRERKAASGELILAVRAPTPERRDLAKSIVRDAGATEIVAS
jgi:hypothetical protein